MDGIMPGLEAAPNIHPMFVHFPVALWPAAAVFMAIAYLRESEDMFRFATYLLYAGVVTGVIAATSGWFAADSMGHDQPGHHLVHDHRNFMLAALVVSALAAGAAYWCKTTERKRKRWLPAGLLLVACLLATLGADRGGLLVYGHGIGVRKQAPDAAESAQHDHSGHSH